MSVSYLNELQRKGSTSIGAPFYRLSNRAFRLAHRGMTIPALPPTIPAVIPAHLLRPGTGTPRSDMLSIMEREDAKTSTSSLPGRGGCGGRGGRKNRRALANALLAQHEATKAAQAAQNALVAQQGVTTPAQQPTPGQPIVDSSLFRSVPGDTFAAPGISYAQIAQNQALIQPQALTQTTNQGSVQPPSSQPPSQHSVPSTHDMAQQLKNLGEQMALLTKTLTEE